MSPLKRSTDVITYREGSEPNIERKSQMNRLREKGLIQEKEIV